MYWFVGLGSVTEDGEQLFKIEDDTDGVVEELTASEIEWYVRHGNFIKYREGAVKEKGKYIGKRFKTDCFDVIPICYFKDSGSLYCFIDRLGIFTTRVSRNIFGTTKIFDYIRTCFVQQWFNNNDDEYIVLYAKSSKDILIKFIEYGTTNSVAYSSMKNGKVSDGLVCHWGIADISSYHYLYNTWGLIIHRCKNSKACNYSRYGALGIDVDESFRYASDFVKWYESQPNYKALMRDDVTIHIDKDLSGRKLYSKDTCYLLPAAINSGFLTTKLSRNDLPIFCMHSQNYITVRYCTINGESEITCDESDKTYSDDYYYNLMMQFFNSRNIKPQWSYNHLVKTGQKWVTAKNRFEEFWYKELKDELEKCWITQEIYDLLLPMVECHITD